METDEQNIKISELMCRTCLKMEADKNLFDEHKPTSSEYAYILESCLSIQVTKGDGLPSRICATCLKKLLGFHNFKITVIENNFKLKKSLKLRISGIEASQEMILDDEAIGVCSEEIIDNVGTEITQDCEPFNTVKIVHPGISADDLTFVTDSDSSTEDEQPISKDVKEKEYASNNNYRCDICGETSATKSKLLDHYETHSGEKPYSCDVCSKKFTKAEHVLIHKRIHTGERPHKCLICKKRFIQYASLKTHLKSHTNKKSQVCTVCGKTFSQSSTLAIHMRIHNDERPFVCQICGKTFRNGGNLVTHVRFHKNERPYGCEQCDRRFFTSSHLNIHARQHSGERPYRCVVCAKAFSRSEHLKGHLVIHSGLKPYQCELCPRKYRQNSHLRRHHRAAHGGGSTADDDLG